MGENEYTEFVRIPFQIQAKRITEENMEEVCELIGHTIKTKPNGQRYIVINRRIVPHVDRAFVGWWVTKMGDHIRCYPNKTFKDQFTPKTDEWDIWFSEATDEDDAVEEPKEHRTLVTNEEMAEAEDGGVELEDPSPLAPHPQIGDVYPQEEVETREL